MGARRSEACRAASKNRIDGSPWHFLAIATPHTRVRAAGEGGDGKLATGRCSRSRQSDGKIKAHTTTTKGVSNTCGRPCALRAKIKRCTKATFSKSSPPPTEGVPRRRK